MQFRFEEKIHHPIEWVYEIMRDRMLEVVPLVPNVDGITILEREVRSDGRIRQLNQWQGSPGSVPALLRPFVKPEMTRWYDYALWDDKRRLVEWRFETEQFKNLYSCAGINYFEDDGVGGTVVRLTGTFELDQGQVHKTFGLMGKKLAPVVEKWLIGLVSPNLSEAPRAVQAFLDQAVSNIPKH